MNFKRFSRGLIMFLAFFMGSLHTLSLASNEPDYNNCKLGDIQCLENVRVSFAHRLVSERESLFVEEERRRLEQYSAANRHLMATLWSQLVVGWVLLFAVLGICGAGLAMSWHQLQKALETDRDTSSTVAFGKAGFRMDSPIVGLVIFVISTIFFYLYLTVVFPVSPLDAANNQGNPSQSADQRPQQQTDKK